MPVPNDLTPEEEAAFVEHGVQPAGQGGEPIAEGQEEAGQEGQQGQEPEGQQEPPAEPKPGELGSRHRADGKFKSMEELEADRAQLAAQAGSQSKTEGQQPKPEDQQQPKMVPHEALHAERLRVAELTRTAQLATTRLNAILAAQNAGKPQVAALPDINEDPAGYIQNLAKRIEAFEQERDQAEQTRQIDSALEQDEALFSTNVPDYDQASDYYVQSRARELLAFYTPTEAQRIMTEEARNIASQAWQRGMSAAQMVYGLAQARGYQPGNTAADPTKNPIPPRPNGGGGPTPQAQVDAIRRAQAASRSLSGGGAGAGTSVLNAEAVLAMSDEEFEEYVGIGKKGADSRFAQLG